MQLPSRPLKPLTVEDRPPPAAAETGEILSPQAPAFSRKGKQDLAGRNTNRISRRLRAAVGHIAHGMNITQAAAKAGCHRNALSLALQRPHVVALLEQSVKLNLAASAGKASMQLDTLIGDARSEYVRLEASKAVLDRAGYAVSPISAVAGDIVIAISL